jgi:hypothetical protein
MTEEKPHIPTDEEFYGDLRKKSEELENAKLAKAAVMNHFAKDWGRPTAFYWVLWSVFWLVAVICHPIADKGEDIIVAVALLLFSLGFFAAVRLKPSIKRAIILGIYAAIYFIFLLGLGGLLLAAGEFRHEKNPTAAFFGGLLALYCSIILAFVSMRVKKDYKYQRGFQISGIIAALISLLPIYAIGKYMPYVDVVSLHEYQFAFFTIPVFAVLIITLLCAIFIQFCTFVGQFVSSDKNVEDAIRKSLGGIKIVYMLFWFVILFASVSFIMLSVFEGEFSWKTPMIPFSILMLAAPVAVMVIGLYDALAYKSYCRWVADANLESERLKIMLSNRDKNG